MRQQMMLRETEEGSKYWSGEANVRVNKQRTGHLFYRQTAELCCRLVYLLLSKLVCQQSQPRAVLLILRLRLCKFAAQVHLPCRPLVAQLLRAEGKGTPSRADMARSNTGRLILVSCHTCRFDCIKGLPFGTDQLRGHTSKRGRSREALRATLDRTRLLFVFISCRLSDRKICLKTRAAHVSRFIFNAHGTIWLPVEFHSQHAPPRASP